MKKYRKFILVADNHSDMIDSVVEKALFNFIEDFKPEVRVHLGDNWDFRNLRRGASDDEKAHSLETDWEMGSDFFLRFFSGGKDNHYLRGNHCERIFYLAANASGLMRDYAHDGIKRIESLVKRRKVNMLPYDSRLGVLTLGHLRCIHGFAAGRNAGAVHARVYGNCFFGHCHTCDSTPVECLDGPALAQGIGCLCKIDLDYNSTQVNKLRHQNAFTAGLLFNDGTYHAQSIKRIGDNFYAPTSFEIY